MSRSFGSILTLLTTTTTVVFLGVSTVHGDSVSSRLMVQIPRSLNKPGGYAHKEALFGMPPYGGSIAQTVIYANHELCDPSTFQISTQSYPRRPPVDPSATGRLNPIPAPWEGPYILMVDRGGCSFVKKVRNAQRTGAAGVLIADNVCLCNDMTCMNHTKATKCEPMEPIMADDGSGGDISIPSFLMYKHDADEIKKVLKDQNQPVQVEMSWALPTPDDRVEYDLWTLPTDRVSKEFFSEFKAVAVALAEHARFTPHMYIYDGVRTQCVGVDHHESPCFNLCSNNGRYCSTDPDQDLAHGVSGADVVKESLRRICIWQHYGDRDGVGELWWNYVDEFYNKCFEPTLFNNDACVQEVFKKVGLDAKRVQQCMDDSGGLDADSPNNKLDAEIDAQTEHGVVVIPSAFVNDVAIRGALSGPSIFHAICAGFSVGTKPEICDVCGACADLKNCVKDRVCKAPGGGGSGTAVVYDADGSSGGSGVTTHTFAGSLLMMMCLFVIVGVWHVKRTQDRMRSEVREILGQYMPLQEQDEQADTMGGGGGIRLNFAMSSAQHHLPPHQQQMPDQIGGMP